MSEDTFRIIVTVAVGFAALAFFIQAFVVIAFYRSTRKVQTQIAPVLDHVNPLTLKLESTLDELSRMLARAVPAVEKVGPMAEKATLLLASANRTVEENRSKVGAILTSANHTIDEAGTKVESILGSVQRILHDSEPKVESILEKTGGLVEDARPRVSEIAVEVAGIAKTSREQVERVSDLLNGVTDRARQRIDQIDTTVGHTVEQVEQVSDAVRRAALKPVRELNGLAAGVSAVVSTLVRGRKSSVDTATQDEEMFI